MKYLAVDLGASSGRTIVGTVENGKVTLEETHRFVNRMEEIDGKHYWNIDSLIKEVRIGIDKSGEINGIGVDTWGVDYGLLDDDGNLVDKPFAYRDSHNEAAMPDVFEAVTTKDLYSRTGTQSMFYCTIFQLMADKKRRPDAVKKAKRLLFMPELITYLLGGEMHTEYCIASTSGLLDAAARDWDFELIETLGYPKEIFGKIEPSGTKAGEYKGTPIFLPPMHDTASAVAAVPATTGDWAFLSSGTWSLLGTELEEPLLSEESAEADCTNEGGVDNTIRYLKSVTGLWFLQESRRLWNEQGKDISFADMENEARATSFDATFDPNDPRFIAPANMLDEIAQAMTDAGQPVPQTVGEYCRCCYHSLAKAYKEQLTMLERVTGKTFERLHIVGGGSKDKLLNQLTANELGIPVIAGPVEATALGNICSQAKAQGVFGSVEEMRKCIAASFPFERFEPQP